MYYECIMNEQQPNSLGHEDCLEWQCRKTWLQWLMWPSTQHIGKVIRASSYFYTWKVVNLVPEACSTVMTRDHHDELAAIDLSMIAVALTPSWLVWILTVMPRYIFHHTCFFCFVFENETLYTIKVLAVFDFYYGEDLSCCQFCQCFKSAACVIIGNFEKSCVYFEAVSAIVPK